MNHKNTSFNRKLENPGGPFGGGYMPSLNGVIFSVVLGVIIVLVVIIYSLATF